MFLLYFLSWLLYILCQFSQMTIRKSIKQAEQRLLGLLQWETPPCWLWRAFTEWRGQDLHGLGIWAHVVKQIFLVGSWLELGNIHDVIVRGWETQWTGFQKGSLIRKLWSDVWAVARWAGYGSVQGDGYSDGLIICRNVLRQTVKLFIILQAYLQKADFVGGFGFFFEGARCKQLGLSVLILGWFSTQMVTPCRLRHFQCLSAPKQLLGFPKYAWCFQLQAFDPIPHLFFFFS